MTERSFFDTNVLVYTDDADAPDKRERALRLWQDHRIVGRAVISVQVLKEYYVASTRKLGVDPRIAIEKLELFGRADVVRDGGEDVVRAARLALEHRLSFWDAMIVAAASSARCTVLFSEDLQAGRRFADLQIVNPFA
jgi:predicted nucleic acid-binding protein